MIVREVRGGLNVDDWADGSDKFKVGLSNELGKEYRGLGEIKC
jgi:hypothetical protein